jgi:hypothetical protein
MLRDFRPDADIGAQTPVQFDQRRLLPQIGMWRRGEVEARFEQPAEGRLVLRHAANLTIGNS